MAERHSIPFDAESEIWRTCVGYELYEVSNFGRVRRSVASCGTWSGRMMNPHLDNKGYVNVNLYKGHRVKELLRVHRLVAATFLSPDPERFYVNHKNGIRHDNRVENLEWCTHSENILHTYYVLNRKPVSLPGESNAFSKLTERDVRSIRSAHENGEGCARIARRLGLGKSTVWGICTRKAWKHVI